MSDGAAESCEIKSCRCGDEGKGRSKEGVDCVEVTAREADILQRVSETSV